MTPRWIEALLQNRALEVLARVLLTFPFWSSGLAKLIDFQGGVAEMEHFGFTPGWLFNIATFTVQIGASALIIARCWTWLAAGALGVFTVMTILFVHTFWKLEGPAQTVAFHTAMEHIGMIGGLILVSIMSVRLTKPAGVAGK